MVTYAFVTDIPPAVPAHDLIFKEVTLTGFWLLNWLRHAPRAEIEQTYRTLSDLVATGVVAVSRSMRPTSWTTSARRSNGR
jgi:hypothetical protein